MSADCIKPMFVSIDPSAEVDELVLRYKRRVRALVGEQQYLSDPPHVTAYLACFSEAERVVEAVGELAGRLPATDLSIDGWHVFDSDVLTGNQTLVLQFDAATQAALRGLQAQVVEALFGLRDRAATRGRFEGRLEYLRPEERQSVESYGFPFTGGHWHPHLTIASIRMCNWPRVARELLAEAPSAAGAFHGCSVYALDGEVPHLISRFSFRACEVSA